MLRLRAVSGVVLLAVSLAVLWHPLTALAAAPPFAPAQIAQRGFESGEPTLSIAPVHYSGDPATAAWWGVTPSVPGVLGSNALWCARTTPSGTRSYLSGYLAYTRGEATLTVSALQDYYSSRLAFRYLYASRGSDDWDAFAVRWENATTGEREDGPDSYTIPLASVWTTRTRDMDRGEVVRLSRDPARIEFEFYDRIERLSETGSGPAIDNIIVSGYKYGPVRSLTATSTSDTVTLDWLKSYRAVDETSIEERPVTYRVWRTRVGQDAWEELTTTRATSTGWVDSPPTAGALYEYAVQEWDTGTGSGYGELATVTAGTPDTVAPVLASNAVATYANAATISVTASDSGRGVASLSWRLDSGATQTVSSAQATVTTSLSGPHTLRVTAVDAAGNQAAPLVVGFTVMDTIAPAVSATVSASYANTATIPVSAADTPGGSGVHSIEYRLDNGTTQTVASAAVTVTTTSYGARTLWYRARDVSGNWSATASKTFSVTDSLAPSVSASVSADYANTATIPITAVEIGGGSGARVIEYRFDDSTTQTVSNAFGVPSLTATAVSSSYGARTITYRARDSVGNWSAAVTQPFTISDTLAPSVSATVGASYANTATIPLSAIDTVGGSGVHSIEYRFDDAATVTVAAATATATTTSYGARTIRYRARDNAGNWSAVTTKAFSVTDSMPPTATTDARESYADTATIRLEATDSGSGVASLSWRVDGAATQTVTAAATTVTVVGSGPHTLAFWATDLAGNAGVPRTVEFGISDGVAPVIDVKAPSGDDTVTVSISATDTGFGVRWLSYALDGGAATTISVFPSVPSTTAALEVGASSTATRTITVWATDASGLVSSASATFRVTDTIAPTITHDALATYTGTATITLTAADTGSGVRRIGYRFGSAATQTVEAATATAVTTATGQVRLDYVAEDRHGNATSGSVTVTVVPGVAPAATVGRISGADRHAVAVGVAHAGWPDLSTVSDVIIANGETGKEADPLAAAGLAGAYDAPVVLTQAARLPAATRSYLTQVASARKAAGKTLSVHIVGGSASIPDARWNEIRAIPGVSATKDRLSGADRYAVTVTIANRIVSRKGIGAVNGVLIINAENPAAFYDALAASPIAFSRTMPMLGVKAGSVPASVGNALAYGPLSTKTNRYVVSSPTFVSAGVYSQVKASKRLATTVDRYAAAAQISTQGLSLGMGPSSVGVASALPDALTGGALFGKKGGVMLFTTSTVLSTPTKSWLVANKAGVRSVTVLGGTASVSESVKTSITAALK